MYCIRIGYALCRAWIIQKNPKRSDKDMTLSNTKREKRSQ